MKKICNCNIPANLQKDMMTESIAAYVASLPAESIVDDDEYEIVADAFDEMLDDQEYDELVSEEDLDD